MGADIHITVGRVARRIEGPTEVTDSSGTELALFNNQRIRFGDIELDSDVPREVEPHRNYALFSFLASVRGNLKPIMELAALRIATERFLDWLNEEHRQLASSIVKKVSWGYDSELIGDCETYDVGEHSRVFYPVQLLTAFDYDQIAMVEDEQSAFNNPLYFEDTNGDTYRTYFEDTNYFEFLDWCVRNNWQFVIFGFDS